MNRNEVLTILKSAAEIDKDFMVFGTSKHKYRLNDPIPVDFVRNAEAYYGFTLPKDYFRFITEIGDGGAGEDYGLYSFREYIMRSDPGYEKERQRLKRPFEIKLLLKSKYADDFPFNDRSVKEHPEKYFVCERILDFEYGDDDDPDHANVKGLLELGSRGCQYTFDLAVTGENRGRVFDTANDGYYVLLANSFEEFYGNWLGKISDSAYLKSVIEREIEFRTKAKHIKF